MINKKYIRKVLCISTIIISHFSMATQIQPHKLPCEESHILIRKCSGSVNSPTLSSETIYLCQSRLSENSSYIVLNSFLKEDLLSQIHLTGSITADANRNLTFETQTSTHLYKIIFTNDEDEAYIKKISYSNNEIIEDSYTLYCNY